MSRWIDRAAALVAVVLVPLLLAVLPLPAVLAACDHWPVVATGRATPNGLAARVRRWLRHGRGPWASTCLTRSLVLYVLLRQHGHDPHLSVGVAGDSTSFVAHAWVTLGGVPLDEPVDRVARYLPLLVHGE